jgi:hypothetical protein
LSKAYLIERGRLIVTKLTRLGTSFAALTLFFLPHMGTSAEIRSLAAKDGRVVITIAGEITHGDADTFAANVKQANDAGKFVANIRLNSEGGNLIEGVKLAEAVRFGKMSTNVGKKATCASACFLIFAAGATKFATYGAQIGVHGASDAGGAETIQSNAATVSMAKIAKDLGVPAAIIGRMVVTPPSEMVWLSPADLQSMGTTMVGRPDQVPSAEEPPVQSQTRTDAPLELHQDMKAAAPATWETMIDSAIAMSSSQNGGAPRTVRSCQPQAGVCATGILFKLNGTDAILLSRQNIDGRIVEREICTFNSFGDMRSCVDWDTKATHRDMKDPSGEWSKVAD